MFGTNPFHQQGPPVYALLKTLGTLQNLVVNPPQYPSQNNQSHSNSQMILEKAILDPNSTQASIIDQIKYVQGLKQSVHPASMPNSTCTEPILALQLKLCLALARPAPLRPVLPENSPVLHQSQINFARLLANSNLGSVYSQDQKSNLRPLIDTEKIQRENHLNSGLELNMVKKRILTSGQVQYIETNNESWEEDSFKKTQRYSNMDKKISDNKRTQPSRTPPQPEKEVEEVEPQMDSRDPSEIIRDFIPQAEALVGFKNLNMEKVKELMVRSHFDVDIGIKKIKKNLKYYKSTLKIEDCCESAINC